jgi:hypothetical protein
MHQVEASEADLSVLPVSRLPAADLLEPALKIHWLVSARELAPR